jgi:hypothetical protein
MKIVKVVLKLDYINQDLLQILYLQVNLVINGKVSIIIILNHNNL